MFRSLSAVFAFILALALGGCAITKVERLGADGSRTTATSVRWVAPHTAVAIEAYTPIYGVQGGYRYREPVVLIGQIIGRTDWREATVDGVGRICSVNGQSPHSCGDPRNAPNWPRR